jgi:protein TonB
VSAPSRRNRVRLLRVAPEVVRRDESPLSPVLAFGSRGHARWSLPVGALVIALLFHALLVLAVGVKHVRGHDEPPPSPKEVSVALEKPPPESPPIPPVPPRLALPREARPSPKAARPRQPPPAPAQASKAIVAAPEPQGPIDMTGFNLVVGEGKSYAGGYSSAKGTSTKAIADPNAVVGGKPNAPPVDRSRPSSPIHREWSCPWPSEEQTSDLRDAYVTIRVKVDADGSATSIDVLNAPPGGFAASARHCAQGERFSPARDSTGNDIASTTPPFVVHFFR